MNRKQFPLYVAPAPLIGYVYTVASEVFALPYGMVPFTIGTVLFCLGVFDIMLGQPQLTNDGGSA